MHFPPAFLHPFASSGKMGNRAHKKVDGPNPVTNRATAVPTSTCITIHTRATKPIYVAGKVNRHLPLTAVFFCCFRGVFLGRRPFRVTSSAGKRTWRIGCVAIPSSSWAIPKWSPRIYSRLEAYEDLGASHMEASIQ